MDRLKKLQKALDNSILIKKKENLFYLTGRSFMHGYLLLRPRNHADRRNAESRGKPSVVFFGNGLERPPKIHSDILKNIGMYLRRRRVLEIEDVFSFAEAKYLRLKIKDKRLKIRPSRSPVDELRQIKEPSELLKIRKSIQIVGKVFEQVRGKLMNTDKKRINTERDLAEFIIRTGYRLGAEDIAFPPIVASGVNAAIPHHVPSSKKLRPGESIIIDFGFKYKNYCSDFTRTIFLQTVPKRLEMAYNQVEKAYNGSIDFINVAARRGVPLRAVNVYQRAVDVLAEANLDKYFIHSLGHGTGLEIHELPNLSPGSKDVLMNGMVFSIEPGVYIKGLGGIRIEDLVYLENGRAKKFVNVSTKLSNNVL